MVGVGVALQNLTVEMTNGNGFRSALSIRQQDWKAG